GQGLAPPPPPPVKKPPEPVPVEATPRPVRPRSTAAVEPEPPEWLRLVPLVTLGTVIGVVLLSVALARHSASDSPPPTQAQIVLTVSNGSVTVRSPGHSEWHSEDAIRAGMAVQAGSSHCILTFEPGDTIRLTEGSIVQAACPAESSLALTCTQGRIWCHFTQGNASVSVPGANVSFDPPGDAEFELTDSHHSTIVCRHGKLTVRVAVGDPVILKPDQGLTVFSNGAAHSSTPGAQDSWEAWNEGLP
ncbi:MAG: hypothetical protein ACYCW6_17520, partial [Candidatus Xenobia bacterium]